MDSYRDSDVTASPSTAAKTVRRTHLPPSLLVNDNPFDSPIRHSSSNSTTSDTPFRQLAGTFSRTLGGPLADDTDSSNNLLASPFHPVLASPFRPTAAPIDRTPTEQLVPVNRQLFPSTRRSSDPFPRAVFDSPVVKKQRIVEGSLHILEGGCTAEDPDASDTWELWEDPDVDTPRPPLPPPSDLAPSDAETLVDPDVNDENAPPPDHPLPPAPLPRSRSLDQAVLCSIPVAQFPEYAEILAAMRAASQGMVKRGSATKNLKRMFLNSKEMKRRRDESEGAGGGGAGAIGW
ncbi:hypothetical protein HDU96_002490 [Phlyctochytrium bullatum]|nr:hypothetical protein HDU96_002490 [Phlyctochytrium bullatum]